MTSQIEGSTGRRSSPYWPLSLGLAGPLLLSFGLISLALWISGSLSTMPPLPPSDKGISIESNPKLTELLVASRPWRQIVPPSKTGDAAPTTALLPCTQPANAVPHSSGDLSPTQNMTEDELITWNVR